MVATSSSENLTLYRYQAKNRCLHESLNADVLLTLMHIPAGEFMMGAPDGEPDAEDDERPQHLVKLEAFLLGRYPVTQAQWRIVAMEYSQQERELDPDPSYFKGDNLPVEQVSWEEAIEFCLRLSEKTGKAYHLPSEAQWEYACRAGTTTPFHFGDMITTEVANFHGDYTYNNNLKDEYREKTTKVGLFPANRWGLHDMHGNVLEWCGDDWHSNYQNAPKNVSAWTDQTQKEASKNFKILRGGSWLNHPRYCRSAYRNYYSHVNRNYYIGFRVSYELPRTFSSVFTL